MNADYRALPFHITESGILHFDSGGCRPAEDTEKVMYERIGELEGVLNRIGHYGSMTSMDDLSRWAREALKK